MRYVKVASTKEMEAENKLKVTLEEKEILIVNLKDHYYAVENTCPHMGGSLYDGRIEGNNIICPRHGSVFDLTNGKAVESGKLFFVKVKIHDIKSYPVKIMGTDIMIGLE